MRVQKGAFTPTVGQSGKVFHRRYILKNEQKFIRKRGAGLGDGISGRRACTGKSEYVQGPGGDLSGLLEQVRRGRRCYGRVEGLDYKGPFCGTESAPYPVDSEIPLKGFEQECNMARFGFWQEHSMQYGSGKGETEAGEPVVRLSQVSTKKIPNWGREHVTQGDK